MKKIASFLPIVVFLVAIGSAFASSVSDNIQGYIKVAGPLPCEVDRQCNNQSTTLCKTSGNAQVFDGSTMNSTSCGVELFHRP